MRDTFPAGLAECAALGSSGELSYSPRYAGLLYLPSRGISRPPAPIPGTRGFILLCAPRPVCLGAAPRRPSCCLTSSFSYSLGWCFGGRL